MRILSLVFFVSSSVYSTFQIMTEISYRFLATTDPPKVTVTMCNWRKSIGLILSGNE